MIFIAGTSISLFISALLLAKKNKSKADVFLMLWMLLCALHLISHYFFIEGIFYEYPQFLGVQMPIPLLQGVFLFYYVSAVTNQWPKKNWYALLHLLPALIAYLYLIPFFGLGGEEKIEIFKQKGGESYRIFQLVLMLSVFLSGIIYVIWCSLLLKKHKKNIRLQFSDIEEINLRWLQFLVYGLACVWGLVICTQNDNYIYMGVALFVILAGFFGVQQKNIFENEKGIKQQIQINQGPQAATNVALPETTAKEKYQSSGLTEDQAAEYYEKLNGLMGQEQLYKNASLSLGDLASTLGTHPNYLSQIINEKVGKSFYDYVNTYRVDEFKRLIAIPENQQFTIMSLAYECGFNSKSSFNRYFKKNTGQTPSAYAGQVIKA